MSATLSVKRLVPFEGESSVRAYCDVALDEAFLIRGLRVVEGKHGLFVSMPRQQGKDHKWYDSVVALTRDAKVEVSKVVLEAYLQHAGAPAEMTDAALPT